MRNIIGWHDQSTELENSIPGGWCVITEELGCNPQSISGKQYNPQNGTTYIVRLNHSHSGNGTLPPDPNQYTAFAETCAQFVAKSSGCSIWIIGNETNLRVEGCIVPANYAKAFNLCQQAIKRVQPNAVVISSAVGPWNTQTTYPGNPSGDWIKYHVDVLELIAPDGIAIHTYSDGHDHGSITADTYMQPPFNHRRYGFRTYIDLMESIPNRLKHLPVFCTETNPNDAWIDGDKGWIHCAYKEINRWNQLNKQQIRALILYRWIDHDKWAFCHKPFVKDALQEVAKLSYQWKQIEMKPVNPPTEKPIQSGVPIKILRDTKLRMFPGYINKPDKDVILSLKPGDMAEVIGDSKKVDDLVWLFVKVFSGNGSYTGWLTQSAPDKTPMIEIVGSRLKVGDRVETTTVVNVRSKAGKTHEVVRQTGIGSELVIERGPQFADGLIWWHVGIGWCAESINGVALLKLPKSDLVGELSKKYGVDVKVIRAIIQVESGGEDRTPYGLKIRFEPHVFYDQLADSRQREEFYNLFQVGNPRWKGDFHRANFGNGFEPFHDGGGRLEWKALTLARGLNEDAGWEACSYGAPQVLGTNYAMLEYSSAKTMYEAFNANYDEQIKAMFRYFEKCNLIQAIRDRDFYKLAASYNGTANTQVYGKLIEDAARATVRGADEWIEEKTRAYAAAFAELK